MKKILFFLLVAVFAFFDATAQIQLQGTNANDYPIITPNDTLFFITPSFKPSGQNKRAWRKFSVAQLRDYAFNGVATQSALNDTATALRASNYRDAASGVAYVRAGADNSKAVMGDITRPFSNTSVSNASVFVFPHSTNTISAPLSDDIDAQSKVSLPNFVNENGSTFITTRKVSTLGNSCGADSYVSATECDTRNTSQFAHGSDRNNTDYVRTYAKVKVGIVKIGLTSGYYGFSRPTNGLGSLSYFIDALERYYTGGNVCHYGGYRNYDSCNFDLNIGKLTDIFSADVSFSGGAPTGGHILMFHGTGNTYTRCNFNINVSDAKIRGQIMNFSGIVPISCQSTIRGKYELLRNVKADMTEWGGDAINISSGDVGTTHTIDADIITAQGRVINISAAGTFYIRGTLKTTKSGVPCISVNNSNAKVIVEATLISTSHTTTIDGSAGTVIFTPKACGNVASGFTGTTQGTLTVLSGLQ